MSKIVEIKKSSVEPMLLDESDALEIIISDGIEITLIEDGVKVKDLDIKIGKNCRIRVVCFQVVMEGVGRDQHVQNDLYNDIEISKQATLGENSRIEWFLGSFDGHVGRDGRGGGKIQTSLDNYLEGDRSSADVDWIFNAVDDQEYLFSAVNHHKGLETTGDIQLRGVSRDKAKTRFAGNIKIYPGAQKTDAYLAGHTLMLDKTAKSEVIPQLEVEADDVKAGHAASVTKLDDEKMFYLNSRGLAAESAKKLLIEGFLRVHLDKLNDIDLKDKFLEKTHG